MKNLKNTKMKTRTQRVKEKKAEKTERWMNAHSVNCIKCGVLFNEREGYTPEDGEGTLCQKCFKENKPVTLAEALNPCGNALVKIQRLRGKRYLLRSENLEINGKNHIEQVAWNIDTGKFAGLRGGKIDVELLPFFAVG